MESSCVRQTLIPGTSRLFGDYLYHFERVSRFYGFYFGDSEAFGHAAREINYPDARRSSLVAALRKQNPESAALSRLAQPGTVAVVTGQQVGLFSGPAYTIFKALTAVRLAQHLSEQGIPAVPIFWLATEDHDLAEVDHAWVFNQDSTPKKISVTTAVTNGGPVGEVRFQEMPISELRDGLGNLPFSDDVMQRVEAAYHSGATFGSAFRSFLQDILSELGLVFIDPLALDVRQLAAPFLAGVVEAVPELKTALHQRDAELAAAGYHAQVYVDDDSSLLFLLSDGKRVPIRWKDGRFTTKERSYTAAELRELSDRISPNALIRPVVQDYLLPTVTYVGGPAEIAYLAQSQVVYERLLGHMPVVFPRNGFTLLDARATKLLNRYDLQVSDLFDHHEHVKSRIAARLVPGDVADELASLRSTASTALEKLQWTLVGFDASLSAAAKKSTSKILYQIDKLTQKTARETMRRDKRAGTESEYLLNLVYPHRHLQERFYSIVPFLAKHGLDLPGRLLEETQLSCPDHMLRTI